MKVLMAACSPGGGITTFFGYVYGNDAFADIDAVLAAPGEGLKGYLADKAKAERFEVRTLSKGAVEGIRDLRALIRAEKPDLLHSHGFRAGVLMELSRKGLRKVPHLMTAHDVFLSAQFRGWKGKLTLGALNLTYSRLDGVHAVSEDCARNFKEFIPLVARRKVTAILHGIDVERFRDPVAEDIRGRLGLPEDAKVIGFFGRFMGQKGFRTLVDAIALLRREGRLPENAYVVTFGWGGFIREDYAYLQELGLGDVFVQHPHTDHPETAMAAVDVVAMPSRWEACGLLGMEALAAGVPIVGGKCIGLREVLAGSPAPLVEPMDHRALANALVELLRDGAKAEFRAYAPEAHERFALERPCTELRRLYSQVAGQESA